MTDIAKLRQEQADTQEWLKTVYTSVCIVDGKSGQKEQKNRHSSAQIAK